MINLRLYTFLVSSVKLNLYSLPMSAAGILLSTNCDGKIYNDFGTGSEKSFLQVEIK